jgi:hypothetical protein
VKSGGSAERSSVAWAVAIGAAVALPAVGCDGGGGGATNTQDAGGVPVGGGGAGGSSPAGGGAGGSGVAGVGAIATAGTGWTPKLNGECDDLFAQDRITTWEVDLAPDVWAALQEDMVKRPERENAVPPQDHHPYRPVQALRVAGETVANVMIRLKGQSSWLQAIAGWQPGMPIPKMQFVIAFDQVDDDAKFHGLNKVELDMPRNDPSMLRQRLALAYLRDDLKIPAQCANSARLVVNGEYYGLYTNLERLDKAFLRRVFPGASNGDLWDGGWTLETNTSVASHPRQCLFWGLSLGSCGALPPKTVPAEVMATLIDMEASLAEWAGEAMLSNAAPAHRRRPRPVVGDRPGGHGPSPAFPGRRQRPHLVAEVHRSHPARLRRVRHQRDDRPPRRVDGADVGSRQARHPQTFHDAGPCGRGVEDPGEPDGAARVHRPVALVHRRRGRGRRRRRDALVPRLRRWQRVPAAGRRRDLRRRRRSELRWTHRRGLHDAAVTAPVERTWTLLPSPSRSPGAPASSRRPWPASRRWR